jgi:hypothetical protein
MSVGGAGTDKYPVTMIGAYGMHPHQVGRIRINGKGIDDYIYTPQAARSFTQTGELVGNPTPALPHTDDHYFHASPPSSLNLKSSPKSFLCQYSATLLPVNK